MCIFDSKLCLTQTAETFYADRLPDRRYAAFIKLIPNFPDLSFTTDKLRTFRTKRDIEKSFFCSWFEIIVRICLAATLNFVSIVVAFCDVRWFFDQIF